MSAKVNLKRKLKKEEIQDDDDVACNSKKTKVAVKTPKTNKTSQNPQWTECELLAEQQNIEINVADQIIKLLEEGNTIPFIARYRRNETNNMTPETLREVKETYEEICHLKTKMTTVLKNLKKTNVLTRALDNSVTASRSIEELEFVYAPYKPGAKRTLAEKAKELGLEDPAVALLENTKRIDLGDFVQSDKKELSSVKDVEKGVMHIIASVISTNTELLTYLRELRSKCNFILQTKKMSCKQVKSAKSDKKPVDESKFENYFAFEIPVKYVKHHQVLAINRGESLKVLSVKIVVPDNIQHNFTSYCVTKWIQVARFEETRNKVIKSAIEDCYTRLIQPLIIREIRADLKLRAERASCEVFSTNLKHLLLATPLKGKLILGIDPGFSNGCKLALVSPMGSLLAHNVIYPHKGGNRKSDQNVLKSMLVEHECELIALGNGTACRQTEEWLTKLIEEKFLRPLDVKYTIVSEDGASIYSCSPEAKKEFATLDPNIISAVSLARRVQEPLAELVKVEPKHLGVGMYQHDIKKKQLEEALNDVVSECVSFVGVDLNTASHCLLRHVAGLSEKRSQQIIQHRDKNGPFISRKDILDVFGIGQRVFQQCAGFLRIGPVDVKNAANFYKNSKTNKLDGTCIHPESYDIAKRLVQKLGLQLKDVGTPLFISSIERQLPKLNLSTLSEELGSNEATVQLIIDALCKPLNHDFRDDRPQEVLFRKGLTNIYDIKVDTLLTGRVTNVTHFGCFADIGVGTNGLIHSSQLNGLDLHIGDKVEVKVLNVEIDKKRIGLRAVKKI